MKTATLSCFTFILWLQISFMSYDAGATVVIDNLTPRTELLSAFGEQGSAYMAQTFIAPTTEPLERLTIELKPIYPFNPVHFRLLLTETASGAAFHPTTVLFESGRQTLPQVNVVQEVSIGLGGTQLIAGQRYAFVLDGFLDRDGLISQAEVGINTAYAGGKLYFKDLGATRTDPREDHFASNWHSREVDFTFLLESVPDPVIPALVDIKPGGSANPVNPKSKGVLSVAILGTAEFDVNDVNIDTLLFGDPVLIDNGGTAVSPLRNAYRDVSHDGLLDLTLKFSTADLVEYGALGSETVEGLLTGELLDGTPFEGMDSIRIVPPNRSNGNSLQISAVPEPTTSALALAALCLAMSRRRSF